MKNLPICVVPPSPPTSTAARVPPHQCRCQLTPGVRTLGLKVEPLRRWPSGRGVAGGVRGAGGGCGGPPQPRPAASPSCMLGPHATVSARPHPRARYCRRRYSQRLRRGTNLRRAGGAGAGREGGCGGWPACAGRWRGGRRLRQGPGQAATAAVPCGGHAPRQGGGGSGQAGGAVAVAAAPPPSASPPPGLSGCRHGRQSRARAGTPCAETGSGSRQASRGPPPAVSPGWFCTKGGEGGGGDEGGQRVRSDAATMRPAAASGWDRVAHPPPAAAAATGTRGPTGLLKQAREAWRSRAGAAPLEGAAVVTATSFAGAYCGESHGVGTGPAAPSHSCCCCWLT